MKLLETEAAVQKAKTVVQAASLKLKDKEHQAKAAEEKARQARIKFKRARKDSKQARKAARRAREEADNAQKTLNKATALVIKAEAKAVKVAKKSSLKKTPSKPTTVTASSGHKASKATPQAHPSRAKKRKPPVDTVTSFPVAALVSRPDAGAPSLADNSKSDDGIGKG